MNNLNAIKRKVFFLLNHLFTFSFTDTKNSYTDPKNLLPVDWLSKETGNKA